MPTPDYPDYTLPIVVIGSVTVVGTVSIVGPVTVEGSVSITGTVTVTGDVVVTGAVTISTIGAENLVIDKLTVGAYTERRHTLENNGNVAEWASPSNNTRFGKFFPRGCRGHIYGINVYCRNTAAVQGDLYIYICPQPSMAPIYTLHSIIPASMPEQWLLNYLDRFWNYDSMFIYIYATLASIEIGGDIGEPYDYWSSYDAGESWATGDARVWIKAYIHGATVGDLPVSGTLNTVNLPNGMSEDDSGWVSVPNNASTSLVKIDGTGVMLSLLLRGVHDDCQFLIYIDGVGLVTYMPSDLNGRGFTSSTPGVSLLKYVDGANENVVWVTLPFNFKRSIEVKGFQLTGGPINMGAKIICNLIR